MGETETQPWKARGLSYSFRLAALWLCGQGRSRLFSDPQLLDLQSGVLIKVMRMKWDTAYKMRSLTVNYRAGGGA